MATREVLLMGDVRLLQRAEEFRVFDTPELHALLADMRDTMHAQDGVGLAAPQIGVNLRVVIFEVSSNPRYPDAEIRTANCAHQSRHYTAVRCDGRRMGRLSQRSRHARTGAALHAFALSGARRIRCAH